MMKYAKNAIKNIPSDAFSYHSSHPTSNKFSDLISSKKKGTKILGLIKNFQHRCVFVQLNIGFIGIVNGYNSISLLKTKYNPGDIIEFQILLVENDI